MKKLFFIAGFFVMATAASAQRPPNLAYVYPAGGRVGSTFQVVVGGQNLVAVTNAFFSGAGIQATVLAHNRPMNQNVFNDLRDRLKALQDKFQATRKGTEPGTNIFTTADAKEREEIQAQILKNPPNRSANAAMIDTVIVQVTISSNALPGDQEIRLATPNALSNPLKFCIGELAEISKAAAKPVDPNIAKYLERIGGPPTPTGTPKYETKVNLPAVINGQIPPGGVDLYPFSARRGQQLVLAVQARSLIPYLADAVPGWFEAVLTIRDAKGKELASAERFRFQTDPVIHFSVPRDGEYSVEIHDSIYRGREDFIYRLTIGELAFVTGIFPPGGKKGDKTAVTLAGWNLPQTNLTLDLAAADPGVIQVGDQPAKAGPSAVRFINHVPFGVDALPEIMESASKESAANAPAVSLPVVINGRISRPGEHDVYKFTGQAGQQVAAEVLARRLNSPLDSFLKLTDAAGNPIAFNDDYEDKGAGLETHHADSYLTATLPVDGAYVIQVSDTQNQGGPEYAYRLRLGEPRPDFALRIVPSSLNLRAGMSTPVTVFALRRGGFTNAIELSLKDAPPGFSLSGARIAEDKDTAKFTLKAPPQPANCPVEIAIEGRGHVGGKIITHTAVPAEDMMQAFIYRHLVPSKELAVMVSGPARPFLRESFKLVGSSPVLLSPGGSARVKITGPANAFSGRFKLELDQAPPGILLTNISLVSGGAELVFTCDKASAKPGDTGNLICAIMPANAGANDRPKKAAGQSKRMPEVTLPAIPFKITTE